VTLADKKREDENMLTEWKKIQLIEIMKEYIIQKKRRVDKTKLLFYSLSVEVREAKQ
jgi:hypothetical protein